MKFFAVFGKSLREQLRSPLILLLTLAFAPFFVLLIWMFFPSDGSTTYTVLVINQDAGAEVQGVTFRAGDEAISAIEAVSYANGSPMLKVVRIADRAEAESMLRDRQAVVFIVLPRDFSRQIIAARGGGQDATIRLVFGGDLTNPYYPVATILATSAVDGYARQAAAEPSLIDYIEEPIGSSAARSEFEIYVPGIFIFAIGMMIFSASMAVAREIEGGTLRRLLLTRMTAFDLLGGISLSLVLLGVAAEMLAFVTALGLGFRSTGPVWAAILIGALTSLSIVGLGMVVAAFSKTVAQAFIIANFPFALFMFFSGSMFPVQGVPLFDVAGRSINLFDVLPPRHAVNAMNKIFTLGAGLEDVIYELVSLLALSMVYFAFGVWVFRRRHLRAE